MTTARVFIATSRDGFIAGRDDDLSWLPDGHAGEDYGYEAFMAETGAIIMGRRTYDVVEGFGIDWPYGETPVFVATSRPLETDEPTVRSVRGTPAEILACVHEVTDGGVYVDGGDVIRQFLDAGLINEATITVVPVGRAAVAFHPGVVSALPRLPRGLSPVGVNCADEQGVHRRGSVPGARQVPSPA
jgi:dihydrofolate reductase